MSNTLIAFKNIIQNPLNAVATIRASSNRINGIGDALEIFVKDAYCGLLGTDTNDEVRDRVYGETFSWLGNQNNIPDAMIRGSDAIEVKKIETSNPDIALNSSYPKNKLRIDDSRIARQAKEAENWKEKDVVYAIGTVTDTDLKKFWFIYGDCYAAPKDVYEKYIKVIQDGIKKIPDVEFHETDELAKIKKVDPLGITSMRVRGMWHIQHPSKVYQTLIGTSQNKQYYLLMSENKYRSFPIEDAKYFDDLVLEGFTNRQLSIRDPANPAKTVKARFLAYEI